MHCLSRVALATFFALAATASPAATVLEITPVERTPTPGIESHASAPSGVRAQIQFAAPLTSGCDYGDPEGCRASAERGDIVGERRYGIMFFEGKGVDKNYDEARKWLALSADKGDALGQLYLGYLFKRGLGVERNSAEAARWFRSSADQDNEFAEFELGRAYLSGDGVAQDNREALRLFKQSATHDLSGAQYVTGLMYASGRAGAVDYREAVTYWRASASHGYVKAESALATVYANLDGVGIRRDDAEAMKWARPAAEKGDIDAQRVLATLYLQSDVIPRDLVASYGWTLVIMEGNATAQDQTRRNELEKLLPASDQEKGRAMARAWREAHPMGTQQAAMDARKDSSAIAP